MFNIGRGGKELRKSFGLGTTEEKCMPLQLKEKNNYRKENWGRAAGQGKGQA